MDIVKEIKSRYTIFDLARRMGYQVDSSKGGFIPSFWHRDSNPSLHLNAKTGNWTDYSMGKGGDVIEFYMAAYNVEFKQALQELAGLCGISADQTQRDFSKPTGVKPSDFVKRAFSYDAKASMTSDELYLYDERLGITGNEKEALLAVKLARLESNKAVFKEFHRYCIEKGWANAAIIYLMDSRKLDSDIIRKFKLFFINNYYEVNQHMKKNFPIEQLVKSGLFNEKINQDTGEIKNNLIFNQHRIIIPYLHQGEIVYLRARYFDKDNSPNTKQNKYSGLINDGLNLNRTRRFFNMDVLHNLLPGMKVYITEGEFDAIALESIGFNALCIPGVGNIPDQKYFQLLKDFDIVLCLDNDEPGEKLKENLLQIFEKMNKPVKIKSLPANTKDLNEFIVKYG